MTKISRRRYGPLPGTISEKRARFPFYAALRPTTDANDPPLDAVMRAGVGSSLTTRSTLRSEVHRMRNHIGPDDEPTEDAPGNEDE